MGCRALELKSAFEKIKLKPFVQRDGAEYYTFLTCPVCDRELDPDDIKSRKCCLIYGKYGVSFNCVWRGNAVRWSGLMEAMVAFSRNYFDTAQKPKPRYKVQPDKIFFTIDAGSGEVDR